jgi:hypothetical protein
MQKKIEGSKVRQCESFHIAMTDSREVVLDSSRGNFTFEQRIKLITQSNQSHVGSVAFVSGSRVCEFS